VPAPTAKKMGKMNRYEKVEQKFELEKQKEEKSV
jgi:hypothetical protein